MTNTCWMAAIRTVMRALPGRSSENSIARDSSDRSSVRFVTCQRRARAGSSIARNTLSRICRESCFE
jgi:hypothetical protein